VKHTLINAVPDAAATPSPCSVTRRAPATLELRADPILVNGERITEDAINREAQHHPAASPAESRAAAARALVVRALLLQRARVLGLKAEACIDGEGRIETEEEALVRQTLEREAEIGSPSDAECRRYYEVHQAEFTAPELFEASHILYEPLSDGPEGEAFARSQAEACIIELTRRPEAFADMARRDSSCPSGAQGGSLGQLQRGDLAVEIERALSPLNQGEIATGAVRTRFGWHVVRLDRRIEARVMSFECALPRIRERLAARAWVTGAARYVARLARAARIEGLKLEPEWI
jgi:peptidyl-prolyl cis-trans isomerase C